MNTSSTGASPTPAAPEKPKQIDFDRRHADNIAVGIPDAMFQNPEQLEAVRNIIGRGIQGKITGPENSADGKQGFGKVSEQGKNVWMEHIQPIWGPIWQNAGGLMAAIVSFATTVFDKGIGPAFDAAKATFTEQTQHKSVGQQMANVFHNINVADPDDLQYTSARGFNHRDLLNIMEANGSGDQTRIDQLNTHNQNTYGVTSAQMVAEFDAYKTDLIYAAADGMSQQARANGWPNTVDGNALVYGWASKQPMSTQQYADGSVGSMSLEQMRLLHNNTDPRSALASSHLGRGAHNAPSTTNNEEPTPNATAPVRVTAAPATGNRYAVQDVSPESVRPSGGIAPAVPSSQQLS